ncbi:helix-turn-helix transcriptional regulator [Catalinimonas sp. 4WD22]|uniref:helix-turn-helix domain-containing protein n=1 Tax=Catalinimonas locisalis TaxID=3133978 RepID=UPI0031013905
MADLYIKNMVCDRCIMVVNQLFQQAGLKPIFIRLGEIKIEEEVLTEGQRNQLDELLAKNGFERIDDKKSQLLEKIKATVIELIHRQEHFEMHINWSLYLSEKLHYDYNYLSSLFSSVTGITLEQYIIKQKIEKAKEYLFYDEFSVKEIAYRLGYSSVAHLSSQFKKITGLTPSEFEESRQTSLRKPLDNII